MCNAIKIFVKNKKRLKNMTLYYLKIMCFMFHYE